MFQRLRGVWQAASPALPPCILSKSRMRQRARTDLCGGRQAIGVPTATTWTRSLWAAVGHAAANCRWINGMSNMLLSSLRYPIAAVHNEGPC
jgi:hypothetical protein